MLNHYCQRCFQLISRIGSIGLVFLLVSCLPEPLEVKSVPEAKPELVVSSQIIPDQSLVVLLTRTFGALDASEDSDPQDLLDLIAVNDAVVTLEGPMGRDTLEFLENGTYTTSDIPFEPGEKYQLYVRSQELGEAFATAEVTEKVFFSRIDADLYYNGFNDSMAEITYTFTDSPEKNWYMINVQEVEKQNIIENLLNPEAFTTLLDDEQFNGTSYGERFHVYPRDYLPGDSIAVSLSSISEEYYQFMKLRIDNRLQLVEFVSEPVDYPSNVIGGKGYFNLYVPDVKFFVFE